MPYYKKLSVFPALALLLSTIPALAGSAVVGSVAGSMNATMSGQALVPNTTVFSGDSLQVKDGAAVVAVGSGSRLVFGRETSVSFLREAEEVTVLLGRGNVSMFHADGKVALRVKVGEISVAPAKGYKTLGEIAMLDGSVVVTAKEGMLRVTGNGSTVDVAKGKTITIAPQTGASPQGGAGSGAAAVNASTMLQVGNIAASGVGIVTSATAASRASDAKEAAEQATATANQAVSAANAATAAANAATAAANDAAATANAVGCAIDALEPVTGLSPYQTDFGGTCD